MRLVFYPLKVKLGATIYNKKYRKKVKTNYKLQKKKIKMRTHIFEELLPGFFVMDYQGIDMFFF
jgi:hypothetical protein